MRHYIRKWVCLLIEPNNIGSWSEKFWQGCPNCIFLCPEEDFDRKTVKKKKVWFCCFCARNFRTSNKNLLEIVRMFIDQLVKNALHVSSETFWKIHLQELTIWSFSDQERKTFYRTVIIAFLRIFKYFEEIFLLKIL